MIKLLDTLFLCLHVIIILFNLFGWIWIRTRKIHFWLMSATLFSWLVLGFRYGLGYCFLTDWHWDIKNKLGEMDLPDSFVKYFLDKYTFFDVSAATVALVTGISFGFVVIIATFLNLIYPRLRKVNHKKNVR